MTSEGAGASAACEALLKDYSLEMTARDIEHLLRAAPNLPAGSRVNLTYLANENPAARVAAARACRELGFTPVPHVAARRLRSEAELEGFLTALADASAAERLFLVGGDPASPLGPYLDAASLVTSAPMRRFDLAEIGIAGYPEGHPDIPAESLWRALEQKASLITENGLAGTIVTQFGFDPEAVLGWVEEVRSRGIDLPVRVGVPGPTGIRRLLRYAGRFGVGTSAGVVRKYGFSITNLMGTAGPERFLRVLADGRRSDRHGEMSIHFYSFGGVATTAGWVSEFVGRLRAEADA